MVKFAFLLRRLSRIPLSKELAERYLKEAPIPTELDDRTLSLLRPIVERERSTERALIDAMNGYATYSDTLIYLLAASLSEEPDEDTATIIAWLQRRVLGEGAPKLREVPEVLPKHLEEKLNGIRAQVLIDQLKSMGLA